VTPDPKQQRPEQQTDEGIRRPMQVENDSRDGNDAPDGQAKEHTSTNGCTEREGDKTPTQDSG
jgi:hypothetical protein